MWTQSSPEGYAAYLQSVQRGSIPHNMIHLVYTMIMRGAGMVARSTTRSGAELLPTHPSTSAANESPSHQEISTQADPISPDCEVGNPSDSPAELESRKRSRESEGDGDMPKIEILESSERYLKNFKTTFREETIKLSDLGDTLPEDIQMTELFDTILIRHQELVQAKDDDRCCVEIRSSEHCKPIWCHVRRAGQISGEVMLNKLTTTFNSKESFLVDGTLIVNYKHIPTLNPAGRAKKRPNEKIDYWIQRKIKNRVLFDPQNTNDSMCLARCVAVGRIHRDHKDDKSMKNMLKLYKEPASTLQKEDAEKLCEAANIDKTLPCGLDQIKQLQDSLPNNRLVVYSDHNIKNIMFKGPVSTYAHPRKNIYLLLINNHFYAILSITGANCVSYFCERCLVPYRTKYQHRCEDSCWRCYTYADHSSSNLVLRRRNDCYRHFAGDDCFQLHLSEKQRPGGLNTCEYKKLCKTCRKTFVVGVNTEKHKCGFVNCRFCKSYQPENHQCYMTQWKPKKKNKGTRYMRIYFDIETKQNEQYENRNNWMEHKPNVLISHQVCDSCEIVKDREHNCECCGEREHIFDSLETDKQVNVVSEFLDYLLELSSDEKTVIDCYSHNGRSFDSYFILQECLKTKLTPTVILQGAKIISLKINNIHFKDSILYLPQKLSSLPGAFGLTELRKGYFPHLANSETYYDYSGPMLDKHFYCTSTMTDKDKLEFEKWYQEQIENNYHFNFKYEILSYCQSDVDILRRAMEEFKILFTEIGGFDPLHNCLTLSSACMAMYRKNHLPVYTIGITPPGGYRGRDKQSYLALQWLDYEQSLLGPQHKIQTAETDREVKILGRPVDGYVEIPQGNGRIKKIVFQLHGCWFHNCRICHTNPETRKKHIKTFGEDRYEKTKILTQMFKENGYTVKEKWECQFNHDLKYDQDTKTFFEQHTTTRTPPLNLRDALCGGRTSALYSYMKADLSKGERIQFLDVCSQYPFANYKRPYPYSHPTIYLENDPNLPPIDKWNGVIKCTVLPPQNLFLPVLPYKCNSKLMFPLCRSCCESQSQTECSHIDEDRSLTGTWCAPELQLAVNKGYRIIKIHEIYQYPGLKVYDPETKTDGLFSSYVRTNMALKIESSGWPSGVKTDEQKDKYIKDIYERDGIVISKDKVEKNPGKRFLAKLILNSFCKYYFEFCFEI